MLRSNGRDLGQTHDFTALAVLERLVADPAALSASCRSASALRHRRTFPLDWLLRAQTCERRQGRGRCVGLTIPRALAALSADGTAWTS
jgi:hypothetical protein